MLCLLDDEKLEKLEKHENNNIWYRNEEKKL